LTQAWIHALVPQTQFDDVNAFFAAGEKKISFFKQTEHFLRLGKQIGWMPSGSYSQSL